MTRMSIALVLCSVLALATSSQSQAQTPPKLEGTFSDWQVRTHGEGNNQVCYAVSEARSMAPATVNHGKVYFLISSWKSGIATEQPSLKTGYPLKVRTPPKAKVGTTQTTMFVAGDEAFIEDGSAERKLVQKMRAGSSMRVSAMSARGTSTNYEFSLSGITAALKKAKAVCG